MHGHVAPLPGTVVKGPKPGKCPTCGQDYEQDRSNEEHSTLFGVIKQAFDSWPEQFHFQPVADPKQGPKHLRGWLLVEVGHILFADVDLVEAARDLDINAPLHKLQLLAAPILKATRDLLIEAGSDETARLATRMVRIPNGVRVIVPKSISRKGPKKIGKREFEEVSRKVYELIETITGASVEEYLKRARYGAP